MVACVVNPHGIMPLMLRLRPRCLQIEAEFHRELRQVVANARQQEAAAKCAANEGRQRQQQMQLEVAVLEQVRV